MTSTENPISLREIVEAVDRQNLEDLLSPGLRIDHILRGEMNMPVVSEDDEQKWRAIDSFIESAGEYENPPLFPVIDFSDISEEIEEVVDRALAEDYEDPTRAGEEFGRKVKEASTFIGDYSTPQGERYIAVSELNEGITDNLKSVLEEENPDLNLNELAGPSKLSSTVSSISDIPAEVVEADDWVYLKMEDCDTYKIAKPSRGTALIYQVKEVLDDRNPESITEEEYLEEGKKGNYYFTAGYYSENGLI